MTTEGSTIKRRLVLELLLRTTGLKKHLRLYMYATPLNYKTAIIIKKMNCFFIQVLVHEERKGLVLKTAIKNHPTLFAGYHDFVCHGLSYHF
jgi:hypothetical protein